VEQRNLLFVLGGLIAQLGIVSARELVRQQARRPQEIETIKDENIFFFFSSRRRHTRSVSAFLLNRSSDLILNSFLGSSDSLVFSELFHSLAPRPLAARSISDFLLTYLATRSEERRVGKECRIRRVAVLKKTKKINV